MCGGLPTGFGGNYPKADPPCKQAPSGEGACVTDLGVLEAVLPQALGELQVLGHQLRNHWTNREVGYALHGS